MVKRYTKRARAGFTLVEMMITAAVSAIVLAAVFSFASFQVRTMSQEQDISIMQSSSRLILESVAYDVRNAGFGTSFWAGAPASAFGGTLPVLDTNGVSLGVPAIKIVNNVNFAGAAPGSDAISLLRIEGLSTQIPGVGAGNISVPAAPGTGTGYLIDDISVAQRCAPSGIAGQASSHLLLLSDLARQGGPASMLLQIAPFNPPITPNVQGNIFFVNGVYGINPNDGARATNDTVPPNGVGPGSIVSCVRPVTYWVDDQGRLRMWTARLADPSGSAVLTGAFGTGLPINPGLDPVLAEGVEDFQIALNMSGASQVNANGWVFDISGTALNNDQEAVETRLVRLSFLMRTPRAEDANRPQGVPDFLEDHDIRPQLDPRFRYRVITFQAELRNMRLFDLQTAPTVAWDAIRSFPQ